MKSPDFASRQAYIIGAFISLFWSLGLALFGQTPVGVAENVAAVATTPRFTRDEDVIYGHKVGVALTFDVFRPEKPNGFGIIYVVSGGWRSNRDMISPRAFTPFLARGYTVFAVLHGSKPNFTIAEMVPDIQRAVRFIRHNAKRWEVAPDHLGITGSSAGGHLSLMIATSEGSDVSTSKDPVDAESSAVQAVGCFYPPTDFLNYGKEGEVATGVGRLKDYYPAFGSKAQTAEGCMELGERYSPARHIKPNQPPILIFHGDADTLVPLQQAELFVDLATKAGAIAKLIVEPGMKHGGATNADRVIITDWFDLYLRGIRSLSP